MLAKQIIHKYEHIGLTMDEIIACAFYACAIAIAKYNYEKSKFNRYWKTIALNELRAYLKNAYKDYFEYGNISISLDAAKKENSLHDFIGFDDEHIKDDLLLESLINIIQDESTGLSEMEIDIMTYYLNGYSYEEIAIICNRSLGTIYRHYRSAVDKIRQKMVGSK